MSFIPIPGDVRSSEITSVTSFLDNKSLAFVRPRTSPGISGFVFDIPEREIVRLSAEITNNFMEDNSFITDHRVKKPKIIVLEGLIGELVIRQEFFDFVLQTIKSALIAIEDFKGDYTPGTQQTINEILSKTVTTSSRVRQIVDRVKNIVNGFRGEGVFLTLQQRAYRELDSFHESNTILTVQTPWEYFESMLIEDIEFVQEGKTEEMSRIKVTLKEARFASVKTLDLGEKLNPSRNEVQRTEKKPTGIKQGEQTSVLFDLKEAAGIKLK